MTQMFSYRPYIRLSGDVSPRLCLTLISTLNFDTKTAV